MEQQLFNLISKMYNEIQDVNQKLVSEIDAMRSDINTLRSEIDNELHQPFDVENVYKFEQKLSEVQYTLTDKIASIFDAMEVQIDRETDISANVKRIENKLDKLELRVVRQTI